MIEPANITPAQAAPQVGVTARTIQRWCRRRWVEHHRTPGGQIRFTATQVAALQDFHPPVAEHPEVLTPNPQFALGLEKVTPIDRAARRRAGVA